jgi:dihydrofolate reductase
MNFSIVLAVDIQMGIADTINNTNNLSEPIIKKSTNTLPWKNTTIAKNDLKFFKELTSFRKDTSLKNALIMGRLTADTFKRLLPNRINIVITSVTDYRKDEGFYSFNNLEDALKFSAENLVENAFVIGGTKLVEEAINNPYCKKVYLSRINRDYNCNIKLDRSFSESLEQKFNLSTEQIIIDDDDNDLCMTMCEYTYI